MAAGEKFVEGDEVAEALAHLLPVDGDHVVVHPVVDAVVTVVGHALGYLTFVVWKFEIHAATVDVKWGSEIFLAHCRAFEVPSGETLAPRAGPVHDMLGRSLFPKGEIGREALLGLTVELAGGGEELIDVAAR